MVLNVNRVLPGIRFKGMTYNKKVNFFHKKLANDAHFQGAQFLQGADFYEATFSNEARFDFADFSKEADFSYARFLQEANFLKADFWGSFNFNYAAFSKDVSFFCAYFKARVTLHLSFLSLTDSTRFDFNGTSFPDTILFANNDNIKNEINLLNGNFTDSSRYNYKSKSIRPIWIYLIGSNVAKLHLDYLHFKLLLPDSTINDPNNRRLLSQDEKASVYEALLNNFKSNGQTESYQLLDIEYQEFKWNHSWASFLTWIPKYWWNFGYDKEYIFVWTLMFLVLLTCFSYFFIHSLNTKIFKIEKIPVNELWATKISFKNFVPRFWSSLMYTSSVFFKFSIDIKNLEFKERRGTFYIVVVYTIGVLCIAYMANFVLQKT